MHTTMVPVQVKTLKIQAGVQVSRQGELGRHLQLWKTLFVLYLYMIGTLKFIHTLLTNQIVYVRRSIDQTCRILGNWGGERHRSLKMEHLDELQFFSLCEVARATDNFSVSNKIGEGGFGPVYKGVLEDGQQVAVKKLSETSQQGLDEFRNEVICIAKLQHRNLVKLLVAFFHTSWDAQYSFSTSSSLFLKLVRDLKASNILLDSDMNPKISDFGLARKFVGHDGDAKTKKVAWRLYKENKSVEIMCESLRSSCVVSEVLRSIHVALLCVQHHAEDRPTMLSVVS
ncbi:G-type lectin S-receptor-like serine/threonine-protein kinase [Tanacetum coccineum]